MSIWTWIVTNFQNGEMFFYVIPAFLFIILLIMIFIPDAQEEKKKEPEPDLSPEPHEKSERDTIRLIKKTIELDGKNEVFVKGGKEKESVPFDRGPAIPLKLKVDQVPEDASEISISEDISKSVREEVRTLLSKEPRSVEVEKEELTQPMAPIPKIPKTFTDGLEKTRGGFVSKLKELFKASAVTDELLEKMEEILYTADMGSETVNFLLSEVKNNRRLFRSGDDAWIFLKTVIADILKGVEKELVISEDKPFVILMTGINGAGKTTTIGKLAEKFNRSGHSVILAAGDTFRAAAVEQLTEWGRRTGNDVISDKEGADPASVAYNSVQSAISRQKDIVIIDTAGRLQNRVNLMEELKKVHRVIGKAKENGPHEVILVVDANNGQNVVSQAKEFFEAVQVSGIIITKLDGTAKGGVVVGVARELKLPIYFIGIGEQVDDLKAFNAADFTEALFA